MTERSQGCGKQAHTGIEIERQIAGTACRDDAYKFVDEKTVSLEERSGTDAVSAIYEQNRQDALVADVFGSPAYVLDGEVFWGQDRIELLADALKAGRASYRSQV